VFGQPRKRVPMSVCAICEYLSEPPRPAAGTVGLLTDAAALLDAALDRHGGSGMEHHVVVPACPEHVVDVYRGRIPGIRMAWRLGESAASPRRQNPAAKSASPA
jgi:hypothetical protein